MFCVTRVLSVDMLATTHSCVCCFFKQKTAYELRISDWSSDVCSSDHFIALSPNRRKVSFQVRQADPVSNTYRLQLLVMDVRPGATPEILDEGGDLILQIVPGMSGVLGETGLPDTITPQWSPDGK